MITTETHWCSALSLRKRSTALPKTTKTVTVELNAVPVAKKYTSREQTPNFASIAGRVSVRQYLVVQVCSAANPSDQILSVMDMKHTISC